MSNRLAGQNSPYLLQHKDNPVDWYPWGEEALNRAKDEDKPIFLSIGYAACHWCHVMAHESFEDPETAAIMNEHFINIKVDREERPDLDGIFMSAVVSLTGQGGWPMSVFLTPSGKPFYGGTYFPPVPRYNMPSFRQVLLSVAGAWREDQKGILESSDKITEHIQQSNQGGKSGQQLKSHLLENAAEKLLQTYDWKNGGWGGAPKFPQPMAIRFLLQRASQGDRTALDTASHALKAMAKGGMYDVVGGGFARYSVDEKWLVPHFEKMLYDNAQLTRVYLYAYMLTGDDFYRSVCEHTLDFVLRELTHPLGGFYSSLDADSEGEEGKYYVWTLAEVQQALKDETDFKLILDAYGITENGNFEGKNVLQRVLGDQELSDKYNILLQDIPATIDNIHQKLLSVRQERTPPNTDDKVLTAWNGWMLTAMAEAARYLGRDDYLQAARVNAGFLLDELYLDDRLKRSWRDGRSKHNAYLEDHAGLALGLLALYQSDFDLRWFQAAREITGDMLAHYRDPQGGFFDTSDDHESLLLRPRDLQDNATPCGNSQAAELLILISAFTGKGEWQDIAEEMLRNIQPYLSQHPTAFANWLCAANLFFGDLQEVAVIGEPAKPDTVVLLAEIREKWRPFTITASTTEPVPENAPELLHNRTMLDGKAVAYVCRNFICNQPVNNREGLAAQLNQSGE